MPESLTFATAFGPAGRLQAQAARFRRCIPRWFIPSFVDLFFLVLVATVFGRPGGWQSLLADGDTGWHIRTGELVLHSGRVPFADVYSFSRAGEPWIAWEWLSDVLFALVYGWRGTGGVAAASGVVLCLAASALFARLLRRGCGLVIGLGVTMSVVSASSIHYLARPHVFSILFYTLALWALDEDRQRQCWRVWLLVPATAIWANLHAGFVALPATMGLLAAVCAALLQWRNACRYASLGLLCFGAGLVNPYGSRLYSHVFSYLRAPWILDQVQEFRSPSIRSEETVVFAVLLLAGAVLASRSFGRGEWFDGVLALAWGFAAMRSARHIAFYMVAVAPLLATETARIWREWAERSSPGSIRRMSWRLSADLGAISHASFWLPIAAGAVMAWAGAGSVFRRAVSGAGGGTESRAVRTVRPARAEF